MPKSVSRDHPDTQVVPEPALEKLTRRSFSAEDKLRIIKEVAACRRGEVGSLLRREKIYHSQLSTWRREFAEHGVTGISKSAPGPKAGKQRRIDQLEMENRHLSRQLEITRDCLEFQKKALSLLGLASNGSESQYRLCLAAEHRTGREPPRRSRKESVQPSCVECGRAHQGN